MELEVGILVILGLCAFVAGFVDSIAGGGGLITIPALLAVGIPPAQALGTNKLQATFGSFSATLYFWRRGYIELAEMKGAILAVFIASSVGTIFVQFIDAAILSRVIPFLLIGFALYFLFSPKVSNEGSKRYLGALGMALAAGVVGFYDGFFGPGTGSFFAVVFVALGGYGITHATANAKLLNFTSNVASLLFFALGGKVLWIIGLVMAIGQYLGARLGSKAAVKHGARIIKPLIVTASLVISARLLWQQYGG